MKKLWKFLGSMRFAIILLVILAAACAGGSFLTQGLTYGEYAALYSERAAGMILGLGLDDVFHAWWFLVLTAFLCGNLLLCNLIRLPQLIRRTKEAADPAKLGAPAVTLEGVRDPKALLAKLRMPKAAEATDAEGRRMLVSVQNRVGLWGAWVCHLGIFLLILGFALGQMTKEEFTVYGVAGEVKPLADTELAVYFADFQVTRAEDGFAEQYEATLEVYDLSGTEEELQGQTITASVNHPGSAYGYKFYQNSMGDAAKLTVRRDGETVQEGWLCAGEGTYLMDTPLSVFLQAVLPEDEADPEGQTRSGCAYLVYVGEELYTMSVRAVGELIPDFAPYEVSFTAVGNYTLIQVKRDRFTPLALAGGLLTLLGLFLAFYLQTRKVWAIQTEDGAWTLHASSPKGGALFADRVKEAASAL